MLCQAIKEPNELRLLYRHPRRLLLLLLLLQLCIHPCLQCVERQPLCAFEHANSRSTSTTVAAAVARAAAAIAAAAARSAVAAATSVAPAGAARFTAATAAAEWVSLSLLQCTSSRAL